MFFKNLTQSIDAGKNGYMICDNCGKMHLEHTAVVPVDINYRCPEAYDTSIRESRSLEEIYDEIDATHNKLSF